MKWYIRGAWLLLGVSVVGWPVSQLTFAKNEPPTVLALSWIAITLTAVDIVVSTHVKRDTGSDD